MLIHNTIVPILFSVIIKACYHYTTSPSYSSDFSPKSCGGRLESNQLYLHPKHIIKICCLKTGEQSCSPTPLPTLLRKEFGVREFECCRNRTYKAFTDGLKPPSFSNWISTLGIDCDPQSPFHFCKLRFAKVRYRKYYFLIKTFAKSYALSKSF